MLRSTLVLLLSTSHLILGSAIHDSQAILSSPSSNAGNIDANTPVEHVVDPAILSALKTHTDPVAALLSLQPDLKIDLAQPRLLHVSGEKKAEWMTEGDKMRLRRKGKKFVDITEHEEFYAQQVDVESGKASEYFSLLIVFEVYLFSDLFLEVDGV